MNGTMNIRLKYPSENASMTKTMLVPITPRSKSMATEPMMVGMYAHVAISRSGTRSKTLKVVKRKLPHFKKKISD